MTALPTTLYLVAGNCITAKNSSNTELNPSEKRLRTDVRCSSTLEKTDVLLCLASSFCYLLDLWSVLAHVSSDSCTGCYAQNRASYNHTFVRQKINNGRFSYWTPPASRAPQLLQQSPWLPVIALSALAAAAGPTTLSNCIWINNR